jgi:hypothetical protein
VGETLTAGQVTPTEANVSYQWQRGSDSGGPYQNIEGAASNTYTLTASDYNCYIRVTVTGFGPYTGTVESVAAGLVSAGLITAIGAIEGSAMVGETVRAGPLTPPEATADYQWQKSAAEAGPYVNIPDAASETFVIGSSLGGAYIRVVASGTGAYTGAVPSAAIGPVETPTIPVTAIGAISGTVQVGETLTAGPLTPEGATASYQWERSAVEAGPYQAIAGAAGSTYTLTGGDLGYYIRVTATGTGGYSGTVTSTRAGPVGPQIIPVTSIGISGEVRVGATLTAGPLAPQGATVSYQWERSAVEAGPYQVITGAAGSTYTITEGDFGYYIRVTATGTGGYSGTATSTRAGPVAAGQITAIGLISGTTVSGQILTAGTLTPFGATATYQWQRSDGTGSFVDIAGATSVTYTLTGNDSGRYIRVVARGTGAYTGEVISEYVGQVGVGITPMTGMEPIGGVAEVGQTLTAGTLSPTGAIATYQWQRADTPGGAYADIAGATVNSYTLTPADKDKYIKVKAIGSGTYSGTLTSGYIGPVAAGQISAVGSIGGTTTVGQTLTAGTVTPLNATVAWQWQKCVNTNGIYADIPGATSNTYILTTDDTGFFIKVVATGTGTFTGSAISAYTGPVGVTTTPVTAIGAISGTAQVTQTLTAGTVNPPGAAVTYQWLRCDTPDGVYVNISDATANSYTLAAADMGKYIKVQATGSGNYAGTVTSTNKGPVTAGAITAIGPISGTTTVGQTLTVGTLTPYGATAAYQWQRSDGVGNFNDIIGGEASAYTLTGNDSNAYIRVRATGTGAYTGTVISDYVGRVGAQITPLTAIGAIGGAAEVGQTLTAGIISPTGAIVTYQWQRADTDGGIYGNIPGATASSYTLTAADKAKYIKVVATGSGNYSGTVISTPKGPVTAGAITAIGPISGTTTVGETLTAGTLTPLNATVAYQWQRCAGANGTYENIPNANAGAYTLTESDAGLYIKVYVTGSGAYTGTAVSAYTGPIGTTATPITSIGLISGTAQVALTLTAGTVNPPGAAVTYQWLRCDTADGIYENIPGATANSYTLAASEKGRYIKVQAAGSGTYSGTAVSAPKGPVADGQLTAIGTISGTTVVGQTLTVGTLTPYGATATYQWQRSSGSGPFTDIIGGTSSTYTLTGNDSWQYIRVVARGTGAYTGEVISDYVGRVVATATPLTAIEAISGAAEVGETLTAGTLNPAGAIATYQWQRADAADGIYGNIPGATADSYTLTAADKTKYIKVVAIGSGNYSGTVTSTHKGPVAAGQLTAIGPISGTTVVGQTLVAGTLTPLSATVNWQWKKCASAVGAYVDIPNANAGSYTLQESDEGYYIKVVATGAGVYDGTAESSPTGPVGVTMTPVTSIGVISGTARVALTLTAGTVNPSGATVTYQWLRCDTADGVYENIPGATANSYTLTASEKDRYIKVQVTGSGSYSGTAASAAKGPVAIGQLTAIGSVSGTTRTGQTLTVGTLTPYGATATYQWQRSDSDGGVFTDIVGGTASTYTLQGEDSYRYIRVKATGSGAYTGEVYSARVGRVVDQITPLVSIGATDGIAEVGQVLTAGPLNPAGTAAYQWLRANAADGSYDNITGATANTYTLTAADKDKFIKVRATGNNTYSGTVISTYKGPVAAGRLTAIGPISGTTIVGETLAAGALTPLNATVTWQWQRCDTVNGVYADIPNATSIGYTLKAGDEGYYIKVVATGVGAYAGTAAESSPTGPVGVTMTTVSAIGPISGTAQVGMVLSAGTVSPLGATVTYQWLKSDAESGTYEEIPGATSDTYPLTPDEMAHYIKVQVTGSGSYSGTVLSTSKGQVTAGQITAISNIIGTSVVGQTLTAGTVTPLGATVTYQWLYSGSTDSGYANINGATSNTYTLMSSDSGRFIKVQVSGTGAYAGTATSGYTGRVINPPAKDLTAIGAIGGTAEVGETLTAGTLSPTDATATWQWQRCTTLNGDYVNIPGANSNTYTIGASDADTYLRVRAAGSGNYTGTVTSAPVGPVTDMSGMSMMMMVLMEETTTITAIDAIIGEAQVGSTLEAGALNPPNATAAYQWQSCDIADGVFENIAGAEASTYTLTDEDESKYIQVMATGTGAYAGTVTSAAIGPVAAGQQMQMPVTGGGITGDSTTTGGITGGGITGDSTTTGGITGGGITGDSTTAGGITGGGITGSGMDPDNKLNAGETENNGPAVDGKNPEDETGSGGTGTEKTGTETGSEGKNADSEDKETGPGGANTGSEEEKDEDTGSGNDNANPQGINPDTGPAGTTGADDTGAEADSVE